jgi:hypothetical protein
VTRNAATIGLARASTAARTGSSSPPNPGGAPLVRCLPVLEGQPLLVPLEDVLPLAALLAPVGAFRERLAQVRPGGWAGDSVGFPRNRR